MKKNQNKSKAKILWSIIVVLFVLGMIGNLLPSKDDGKSTTHVQTKTSTVSDYNASSDTSTKNADDTSTENKRLNPNHPVPFSLTMLDVGQGLSILICADDHYMLYDGGGRESSSFVVSYLKRNSIEKLDYVIASHYDEDHISGLNGVLNTTTVNKALVPNYVASTRAYTSFMRKLETTGTDYEFPSVGESFGLGDAQFQIVGPDNYNHGDDNDCSISIRMQYGSISCILTGDSTESVESYMISNGLMIDSDIYIVGHHGSSSSSSDAFLDAVSPKYAFISVGIDNSYGHPTERVLSSLKKRNIDLFRSDVQGSVTAFSDGTKWWFDTDPSEDWSAGNSTKEKAAAPPVEKATETSAASTYILNIHTQKFHYPDCSSVSRMNDENKETVTATREELINQGYSPCGNCHP